MGTQYGDGDETVEQLDGGWFCLSWLYPPMRGLRFWEEEEEEEISLGACAKFC